MFNPVHSMPHRGPSHRPAFNRAGPAFRHAPAFNRAGPAFRRAPAHAHAPRVHFGAPHVRHHAPRVHFGAPAPHVIHHTPRVIHHTPRVHVGDRPWVVVHGPMIGKITGLVIGILLVITAITLALCYVNPIISYTLGTIGCAALIAVLIAHLVDSRC